MTTVKVGTIFNSEFAYSISEWKVIRDRGDGFWHCTVISEDWAGKNKVFSTEDIVHHLTISALLASGSDWWDQRTIGETVHYYNGLGSFVCGVVVESDGTMQMQPTALVGAWSSDHLPSRARDGSVHYPYHVKKILGPNEDSLMQPHESNMWESSSFRKTHHPDPRALPAIDLSDPPEFEGEEAKLAVLEKARMTVAKILGEGYHDPKLALIEARKLIDEALARTR